ncbi:MAG: acetyl-CoA carboxylase carboxyl transferase subunit beta [Alphaproteobacteria bacterium]|nr:acetyl-CoA carboxylase carboxyl transferase subunit beta [Alphaproteobacteria bacterium]
MDNKPMNWLTRVVRPKIQAVFRMRDTGESLWDKCPACDQMIFQRDLIAALNVCPNCQHHLRLDPKTRMDSLFDGARYDWLDEPVVAADPLKFRDQKRYPERLREAKRSTGREEAMRAASGHIDNLLCVVGVQDFSFMGGSMGMAVGEMFIAAAEKARALSAPLIIFAASGGARMQEGMLSLMQMPRTTIAIQMLREAGLPYIVVLTDPTTGGVTASYAMLGDVHIAEPNALIGFAGQRVIMQTIREKLPEGFQRAETVRDKGMIDMVVHRKDIRQTLSRILRMLMNKPLLPHGERRNMNGAFTPIALAAPPRI